MNDARLLYVMPTEPSVPTASVLARVRRALRTWPTLGDWIECAIAVALLTLFAFAFGGDLLAWAPRDPGDILRIFVITLFVPSLGEEIAFRAALIPDRWETPLAVAAIAVSTALFVLWHVVETLWLPGARELFLRVEFLAFAAALGLACAILRWRSGSIWTAVQLHWTAVVVWQGWLGGPSFGELL